MCHPPVRLRRVQHRRVRRLRGKRQRLILAQVLDDASASGRSVGNCARRRVGQLRQAATLATTAPHATKAHHQQQ